MNTSKWLLFAVEIYLLLAMCNGLFLVPGPYYGPRGEVTALFGLLAGVCSLLSGRIFQKLSSGGGHAPLAALLTAPPVVVYFFVLLASALAMLFAVLAMP